MSERYCILGVDDDVSGLESRAQDRDAQLQLAAKDSKRAADLASIRFRNGATGLLDLLDAQMAQLKDEDALCGKLFQQRSLRCSAVQVACWGWPQRPPQPPKA